MAAVYIMCRALVVILKSVPNNALGQAMGNILEETTFEPFRRPNLKLLANSANYRANAELLGKLLGHLANLRSVYSLDIT
jgi:Cell morphogenesis N-terminal